MRMEEDSMYSSRRIVESWGNLPLMGSKSGMFQKNTPQMGSKMGHSRI
jgi:hypothetical protein